MNPNTRWSSSATRPGRRSSRRSSSLEFGHPLQKRATPPRSPPFLQPQIEIQFQRQLLGQGVVGAFAGLFGQTNPRVGMLANSASWSTRPETHRRPRRRDESGLGPPGLARCPAWSTLWPCHAHKAGRPVPPLSGMSPMLAKAWMNLTELWRPCRRPAQCWRRAGSHTIHSRTTGFSMSQCVGCSGCSPSTITLKPGKTGGDFFNQKARPVPVMIAH